MTPELSVFLVAAAVTAFAYVAIYPRLRKKTLTKLMIFDSALSAALLLAVGWVYFGTQTAFSLWIISVPWWIFTIVSAAIIEVPFFLWFCKRWDIDLDPPTDQSR